MFISNNEIIHTKLPCSFSARFTDEAASHHRITPNQPKK